MERPDVAAANAPDDRAARSTLRLAPNLPLDQDFQTTDEIIHFLSGNDLFVALAEKELEDMLERDRKDGELLSRAVREAVEAGSLEPPEEQPRYEEIDVMQMDACRRARRIVDRLPGSDGDGCAVVLVGSSGTGKGTTVKEVQRLVPRATTWSNGDCFRCLALLAVTHCEKAGKPDFDPECLTPENVRAWAGMLKVDASSGGDFDIRINGLGVDERVSDIQNTVLRQPKLSQHLPCIASKTQVHVLDFARGAIGELAEAGKVVLLEGREETLDFIPSEHRFRLVMPARSRHLLGGRRAAQRVVAQARQRLREAQAAQVDLDAVVLESLAKVVRSSGVRV